VIRDWITVPQKAELALQQMKDIPEDKLYMHVTDIPEAKLSIFPEDTQNQPPGHSHFLQSSESIDS
jgi:hypothetical protein